MQKIRVITYILIPFLSWTSGGIYLGSEAAKKASASVTASDKKEDVELTGLERSQRSGIIGQEHLKGKITQMEEPLLPRSLIVPSSLRTPIDTRISKVGDTVTVQIDQDLFLAGENIIPAGSYMRGQITKLERPGRMLKDPKVEVDFSTVYIGGAKEQIHVLGTLRSKQLMAKATHVYDGASYKSKAIKTGALGGVLGATTGYAYTTLAEPFSGLGIGGMLNNLTILGAAGTGILIGMSMITRDDARIETGTALDIILQESSEAI